MKLHADDRDDASGSGTDQNLAPFTCVSDGINTLQLEIFDVFATMLTQLLGCAATESSDELLFTIAQIDSRPIIITSQDTATVDDYLDQGSYQATVEVCLLLIQSNDSLSCQDDVETGNRTYSDVTIVVGRNTKRLFPYGAGDTRFSKIDDEIVSIVSSNGIPFFTGTYNTLHVS